MAERFLGFNRGALTKAGLVAGAATTATLDIELRIDLASSMTRGEMHQALEVLEQALFEDGTNLPG